MIKLTNFDRKQSPQCPALKAEFLHATQNVAAPKADFLHATQNVAAPKADFMCATKKLGYLEVCL